MDRALISRPYKALFVTHDTGHYGAARSLQTFLSSYETRQADLLINRSLRHHNNLGHIRSRFGPHVVNIWEEYLPFDCCFKGRPTRTVPLMARNVLARWGRRRLLEKIAVQKFDFIYLNSLVLHSLIDPDLPFIIHVREIYDGENSEVAKSLAKAHGVIFIDRATRAAFSQLSAPWVILNNPFNMQAADVDSAKSMSRRLALGNHTVFTLIGMMNENKGTDFVIDAFNRANRDDAVLLVVGGGTESYEKYCRKLAGGSSRIIFHGFEEDVASIYAISDYIIRGEAYPCIGRTIYEGLYSGCAVVIPGDASTARDMFEYDRFNEKVYFYAPRQLEAIVSLFQNLKKLNIRGQASMPNVSEFINNFDAFIGTVLGGCSTIRTAGAMSGASSLE